MKINTYIDEKGKIWSYGEFFKPGFSKFPYNKSNAMKFFPKTKEEVLAMNYSWDDTESPSSKATMTPYNVPDKIHDTLDSIVEEILECSNCSRGYKIVMGELFLLRKMNLPVPHECPKCREAKRFEKQNKPGMYNRTCDKCRVNIYTPYEPSRPEIV